MSKTGEVSKKEIQDAYTTVERSIKRTTLWLPIVVSLAWGISGVLGVHQLIAHGSRDMVVSYVLMAVFAVFQTWVFWDLDARRRTLAMKYDVATGFLDHLAEHGGWEWGESTEPGSVALRLKSSEEDEESETEEK